MHDRASLDHVRVEIIAARRVRVSWLPELTLSRPRPRPWGKGRLGGWTFGAERQDGEAP
jgi:hypothetical protein